MLNKNELIGVIQITLGILILVLLVIGSSFGIHALYSKYNVWSYSLSGQAKLNEADWSRQIAVREALAKRDSSVLLAQAEVERAKGVALANKIIGDSLKDNEGYLKYLWIDGLQHTGNQIIYVPTESSLPILESTRGLKHNK